nr:hypothetical protein [Tanacetum cinerariifolium]
AAFHAINARRLPLALLVYTLVRPSVISGRSSWILVLLQISPAPLVPAGQHVTPEILAAHTAWIKGSKEIVRLMLMTMEPEIQQNLENLHAHEMLLELKTLFALQAEQKLLQTIMGKTINELHAMLKLHEQSLPKNNALTLHAIRAGKVQKVNKYKKSQPKMAARGKNMGMGKNKLAYAPKPKIPPPPKREDLAKDSICHECASGAGGSGIFVIELNTILIRSWIYDTGCEKPIPPVPVAPAGQQEEGQSVSSYVLKIKGYIDNLERLGYPVTLGLGNYNMHRMEKTVNELHAMLKLYEQTLPKSNAPALNAIQAESREREICSQAQDSPST